MAIILKCFLKIQVLSFGLDLCSSEYGPVAGFCDHGSEPFGSVSLFVAWLSDYKLFKKFSTSCSYLLR
jgi:hypothetical protein